VKVADLVRVLDQLQQIYALAGANAPAKDFRTLTETLTPYVNLELAAFVTQARENLNAPKEKRSKKSAGRLVPTEPVNVELVASYVAALKNVGTNLAAFDELFRNLKADNRLGLKELTEVAHQYSAGVSKYRTVAAAQSEISKAFIRHARFVNKLRSNK
jgi:hypothetical protein